MKKESIKLLADFLGLETREDWRESNKGNIVKLNLDTIQDQAYIRCKFKRFLLNCKNTNMRVISNRFDGYMVDLSDYDLKTIEGRNKVLDTIDLTTKEILFNNQIPSYLKFI